VLQSFIIVLREGFEAFLIVAVILSYLRKTGRSRLSAAVYWACAASVLASAGVGYILLQGVNQALWEGVLGLVAIALVVSLVVHMWKTAPLMKKQIEQRVQAASSESKPWFAFMGVFFFSALMITREGMETALMLLQVRDGRYIVGSLMGLAAAALMAWCWAHFSHLINLRRFFQVTGIFLLLFMVQVAIYSFHELAEAGVLPNSEELHAATEPFSPVGTYGQWFSLGMMAICAGWLLMTWASDRLGRPQPQTARISSL
jgi:high-affinity iron transporter